MKKKKMTAVPPLLPTDFEIMPSTLGRLSGRGAFYTGDRVIEAGEVLGQYRGVHKRDHEEHTAYCLGIESDDDVCIDGEGSTHWTAYMNDAGMQRRNNVCFVGDGDVVAMYRITPGSELFVSYGQSYWRSRNITRT